MLVGSFKTQSMTAKFNGEGDMKCKVCNAEKEDILHLVVKCGPLQNNREQKIQQIRNIYVENGLPPPETEPEICSAILNGNSYIRSINDHVQNKSMIVRIMNPDSVMKINLLCNLICGKIARERSYKLQTIQELT